MRLQQLDKIYVDVITLRDATTQHAHTFKIHLPPIDRIIDGERVLLSAALQVRIVVMLCTTAQSIAIKVSVDDESVGELAPIRVDVGAGRRRSILTKWRCRSASARASTASCSPARGAASRSPSSCSGREVFSTHDLADLEAEARLLGQLLHKNIVWASAASRVEPMRCCLVTELAPFGSLKLVLDKSR